MFYNASRITKSLENEMSPNKNINQKLLDIQKENKINSLLIMKYFRKQGVEKPYVFFEEELNKIVKGEKLCQSDFEKMLRKIKELKQKQKILNNRRGRSIPKIKANTNLDNSDCNNNNENNKYNNDKMNTIAGISPININKNKSTFEGLSSSPIPPYINRINNSCSKNRFARKIIYIKPEVELAQLEAENALYEQDQLNKLEEKSKILNSDRPQLKTIDFFAEGSTNEYEAIAKFNKYLNDVQKTEERDKENKMKKLTRENLDKQILLKNKFNKEKKDEKMLFDMAFKEHLMKLNEQEKQKFEQEKEKMKLLKANYEKQIEDKNKRKKIEILKERKDDNKIIKAIKEEMEKEKKILQEKKQKQSEIMNAIIKENQNNFENNKREKIKLKLLEDKKYTEDYENNENKKDKERQNLFYRIRNYGKTALEDNKKLLEEMKRNEIEENNKILKVINDKNRLEEEKENLNKLKEKEEKIKYRRYLEEQIKNKQKEKTFEKLIDNEIINMWKKDSEKYSKEEKEVERKIRLLNKRNLEYLKEQIKDKKQKEKEMDCEREFIFAKQMGRNYSNRVLPQFNVNGNICWKSYDGSNICNERKCLSP